MSRVVTTQLSTLADLLTAYSARMRAHAATADDGDYTMDEIDDIESAVRRLGWRLGDLDGWLRDRPDCPLIEYVTERISR